MTDAENAPEDRGTVLAERRMNLAIKRSAIAAERTLMAWIRTAISMIGFGFTIFKFFQYMHEESPAALIRHAETPRNLGMTLVAVGTLASGSSLASGFPNRPWRLATSECVVHLFRCCDCCCVNWGAGVLRCATARRAILSTRCIVPALASRYSASSVAAIVRVLAVYEIYAAALPAIYTPVESNSEIHGARSVK